MGAVQLITGGHPDNPSRTAQSYHMLTGCTGAWTSFANIGTKELIVPAKGYFRKFRAYSTAAPGTGKRWNFYIYKNATFGCFLSAIVDTSQYSQPMVTNYLANQSFNAGDTFTLSIVPNSTPAAAAFSWSIEWVPDDGKTFILMGGTGAGNLGNNFYMPIGVTMPNGSSTERYTLTYSPLDTCDLTAMYVRVDTAPGVGNSRKFTFRNTASDTTMAVTISGTATTGNNTTDVQSFILNDELTTKTERPTGTPAATVAKVSYAYVPTTYPGEFMICGNSTDSVGASTNYAYIGTGDIVWTPTSTDRQSVMSGAFYFTRMTAWCSATMDVGSARVFRFLRNGSDFFFDCRIEDGTNHGTYDLIASVGFVMTAGNNNCQIQQTIEGGPSAHRLGFAIRGIYIPPAAGIGGF